MKISKPFAWAALCLAALAFQGQALAAREVKDAILKGDAKCTKCHDETEAYPVLSMAQTKHGVKSDGRLPSCVGCHGESETHTNKPEGMKERPKPEFPYGKRTKDDIAGHNQVCADCHKGGRKFMDWAGSAHAARDVACTDCHKLHIQRDPVRDKRTQSDVCYACHKEQRVLFNKPSHHPVPEAKMACADCHASHGSSGPKLMQRDTIADTCGDRQPAESARADAVPAVPRADQSPGCLPEHHRRRYRRIRARHYWWSCLPELPHPNPWHEQSD